MKKYLFLIISIILFSFPLLKNEFYLVIFSNQLDRVDDLITSNYRTLSSGSSIFVSGNDKSCIFEATRVYRIYTNSDRISLIKSKIESMVFSHAKTANASDNVETYVLNVDSILIVSLQSGPLSAGLDFRCW